MLELEVALFGRTNANGNGAQLPGGRLSALELEAFGQTKPESPLAARLRALRAFVADLYGSEASRILLK